MKPDAPQQQAEPRGYLVVDDLGDEVSISWSKPIQHERFTIVPLYAAPPPAEAVALLRELCRLKAYKDTLGKTADYERDKAAAWSAADAYLARKEQR